MTQWRLKELKVQRKRKVEIFLTRLGEDSLWVIIMIMWLWLLCVCMCAYESHSLNYIVIYCISQSLEDTEVMFSILLDISAFYKNLLVGTGN